MQLFGSGVTAKMSVVPASMVPMKEASPHVVNVDDGVRHSAHGRSPSVGRSWEFWRSVPRALDLPERKA